MLKRFGAKADTSNNEMEYRAILEALEYVPTPAKPPLAPLVVMETDSQTCIDGLTKYRKRWEAHRWKKDDGKPVENADLIQPIGQRLDKMHVGFWKVKGHNNDPWNDLADSPAVRGRNQSASEVTIQVLFRPTVDGEEKFWAIPRLSLNANANIYDFWAPLVDKFGRHGDPEDYEIWNGHTPLERPLIHGLGYEIVPRSSPGRPKPAARRNSADFSVKALDGSKPLVQFRSKEWSPRPLVRTDDPAREVPPQWRAQVIYQESDAPEKEWRGWFTEEDTEYAIERRARTSLGIFGTWRRASYWRDNTGIRIVMTNRRKEISMRCSSGADGEIKEVPISEDDTVKIILLRIKAGSNFHLADNNDKPFGVDDCPFGYVSTAANPPSNYSTVQR
jgi:ribonuclease HI